MEGGNATGGSSGALGPWYLGNGFLGLKTMSVRYMERKAPGPSP